METIRTNLETSGIMKGRLNVELNRPSIRNAFNETMIAELGEVFRQQVNDPNVKVVVLSGAGEVFSAGGDLGWMKKSIELSYEDNLKDTRALTRMFEAMNTCAKPLVGQIHGAAIGGGVGLTSVCDFVVATEETQFSLSEVRLGIVPACIGPFVISKVGVSHARELFLSAERFLAPKAKEIGLVHELCKTKEALRTSVDRIVQNMLSSGPNALIAAKRMILDLGWPERRKFIQDPMEYVSILLAELRISPEGQEGLRAFLEKRKPSWQSQ